MGGNNELIEKHEENIYLDTMFMDWKITFVKISPNWLIELMQLYSKLNRALERTWQDASVIYIEKGQEEKTLGFQMPQTILFCSYLSGASFSTSFLSFPASSWSYVRMPQGSGLQLLSTITLTPLVNFI